MTTSLVPILPSYVIIASHLVSTLFVCVILLVVLYCAPHEYLQLRHDVTPVRDPQTGTTCQYLWCIPIKSDILRRTLKRTCFAIKSRVKLGLFIILFEYKRRQITHFLPPAGPPGAPRAGPLRPRGGVAGGSSFRSFDCGRLVDEQVDQSQVVGWLGSPANY